MNLMDLQKKFLLVMQIVVSQIGQLQVNLDASNSYRIEVFFQDLVTNEAVILR